MCKLCVFAGTSEGRTLIERLSGRGAALTACVATEYGSVLMGEAPDITVRSGRMDADEMAELLRAERFDAVIDATHPYAAVVTENIVAACARTQTEYLRLLRGSGSTGEDGVFVPDTAACAEYLKGTEGSILLTTGSKELPVFCADEALRARVFARVLPMQRSLEICAECGIAPDHIIAMQGPFSEEMNIALVRAVDARFMVTKDTGKAGGYDEKIRAAAKAGATAVIIGRPPQREGLAPDAMLAMLEARFTLTAPKKTVHLVGIGMGNTDTRTLGMERVIAKTECLIGAKRMLDSVTANAKRRVTAILSADIASAIREGAERDYTVLLSGDTGFYSGAKALVRELTDCEVEVLPGIGSLTYFCAKLRRGWDDVRAVSLHGRECDFVREVRANPAVFTLLGGNDGAVRALSILCDAGLGHLTAHVGERLGYPDERITHGTAAELRNGTFDALSVLLVEDPDYGYDVVTHGLPDEAFDRDETPMTKMEIRAISLSKLALTPRSVAWDVGAGSGSVSVEMALQAREGKVYAVEMKEKALALTKHNAEKFALNNLEVIAGKAPDALRDLPAPTHVFIGGSSGNMREIIDLVLEKNPHARIVVNTVTLESLAEAADIAKDFRFCDVAEVNVSKPRVLGRYRLMTAQNPVFIFTMQNGDDQHGGEEVFLHSES